jgi:hypothetical protein
VPAAKDGVIAPCDRRYPEAILIVMTSGAGPLSVTHREQRR